MRLLEQTRILGECVDDRVLVFQPRSYDLAHGLIVIDYQDLSHDFPDSP
jgi:hypothetical protein